MDSSLISKIEESGRDVDQVNQQLEYFKKGFPFLNVERAAAIDDGILRYSEDQIKRTVEFYQSHQSDLEIVKFVPASGAASRMFKQLFEFKDSDGSQPSEFVQTFIDGLPQFAFNEQLDQELQKAGKTLEGEVKDGNYQSIIKALLDGLNYGQLPKGLLSFHKYEDEVRTPVEEHFAEGAAYAQGANSLVQLHFTVSPEHQQLFEDQVEEAKKKFKHVDFNVSFSQQKKSTDTIAVTPENEPFYEENGEPLFRPAGHGALLDNLNDIDADLIFIKNIDNVVPDYLKKDTIRYKQVIAGMVLQAQQKVFESLRSLDSTTPDLSKTEQVASSLSLDLGESYDQLDQDQKMETLRKILNRPIRVCGIVENTGEPGGGPFWVKGEDNRLSLQIGETAQLNSEDDRVMGILKNSTHFSPTDVVCGVRNYKGEKFNLMKYRDPETGFISEKSKNGRKLKALELPGLWNGSMSDWITLFCEVPLITFNPVKTINDLLRPEHQPG
ncbi:MAG: DUF4301 family protein [Bacteroidota bacterium]